MNPTREQVLDMSIASGLNDMLRLDSEASRILSVQRLERFAALVHAAARAQALDEASKLCEMRANTHKTNPIAVNEEAAREALMCSVWIDGLKGKQ